MATKESQKTVYFRFDGHNEVHSAPAWRLESAANEAKFRTGVPVWTRYQIINPNDIDPNPTQDLVAAINSTDDGHIAKPTVVDKPSKRGKAGQKAVQLPDVLSILDEFVPAGNIPESDNPGTDHTISDSVPSGDDV
jgi:hypothetical protein